MHKIRQYYRSNNEDHLCCRCPYSQYLKSALFSQKPGKEHTEILVHTGQHYDAEMSDMVYSGIIPVFMCCRK